MKCAWQAYLNLLPQWMRREVDNLGQNTLQEMRIRRDRPPELVLGEKTVYLSATVTGDDIQYCVNAASRYSPWAAATISEGYITAPGGHRLGICGDIAVVNGVPKTISNITSICMRVARDFPGIGLKAADGQKSLLIIGSPGSGKTTLLRDLVRQKSRSVPVAVVDERRELFPAVNGKFCFAPGERTDVLSGCGKPEGIEMMIRTMNPRWIAVDEITAEADCQALIRAYWCGVSMFATAHGGNLRDFINRPVYRSLVSSGIFRDVILMQPDKSWKLERLNP